MLSDEPNTQAFIVRIWREQAGHRPDQVIWRGHITHVPSGERCYLKRLDDIFTFMVPHLLDKGIPLGWRWRLWRWWRLRQKKP
jgi:hypothetical protein